MTGWIAASIPVWIAGAMLVMGAFYAAGNRYPGETSGILLGQFIVLMVFASIVLGIAGWMSS